MLGAVDEERAADGRAAGGFARWTAISFCGRIPPLMRCCNPRGGAKPVWRGRARCWPALQPPESGHCSKRSRYVGSRTGCGEVVQRFEGLRIRSAAVGGGCFRSLLRDSDGRIQIAHRGPACGVRGEAGPQGPSGRSRHEGLAGSDPSHRSSARWRGASFIRNTSGHPAASFLNEEEAEAISSFRASDSAAFFFVPRDCDTISYLSEIRAIGVRF